MKLRLKTDFESYNFCHQKNVNAEGLSVKFSTLTLIP